MVNLGLNGTSLLAGGAAVGLVAAFWGRLKGFISKILGFFIVSTSIENAELSRVLVAYCFKHFKKLSFGEKFYDSSHLYIKHMKRVQLIGYEDLVKKPIIMWNGWKPIFLGQISSNNNASGGGFNPNQAPSSGGNGCLKFTFIRGTIDVDKLIEDAVDFYNMKTENGFGKKRFLIERMSGSGSLLGRRNGGGQGVDVYSEARLVNEGSEIFIGDKRFIKYSEDQIGATVVDSGSAFKLLAFPEKVNEVIEDVTHWKNSEEWYRSKNISWRRGILLSGGGGCVLHDTKIKIRKKKEGFHKINMVYNDSPNSGIPI